MFKGLKSKLEDEAKKIQASVQQYGEQITQQVGQIRSNASDAGSDAGSTISRRFMNTVGGGSSAVDGSQNNAVGNALMEEVAEGDLLGLDVPKRERRWSGDSSRSVESSLSTLFQSVPGMASVSLHTVESDDESWTDGFSPSASRPSSENKHGDYRLKYKDLVKKYNELVAENKKMHVVLVQGQDKAINRIEKLRNEKRVLSEKLKEHADSNSDARCQKYQVLLDKCKEEIKMNRTKIKELTEQTEQLKSGAAVAEGESGISELVTERVSAEWKQRIDKVEEDWTERINKSDADHAIQLATTKAEMHAALESKDKEIESWRSKCRTLEVQDGQANERWQAKVDELQAVVKALETEKNDQIEKLSMAKQQGVQAVREEEENKRAEMLSEWKEKEEKVVAEAESQLSQLKEEHAQAIEALKAELLNTSADGKWEAESKMEERINELETSLSGAEEKLKEQSAEMSKAVEFTNQKLHSEVADLIREHEEITAQIRSQHAVELSGMQSKLEHAHGEVEHLRSRVDSLQKDLDAAHSANEEQSSAKEKDVSDQLSQLQSQLSELTAKSKSQLDELTAGHAKETRALHNELDDVRQELEQAQRDHQEAMEKALSVQRESDEELSAVKTMLDEKSEAMHTMENNYQQLEAELASAKELSAMHEHLREELEEAREQRTSVELRVLELAERAERAEKALQEDRLSLEQNKQELEDSIRLRHVAKDNLVEGASEREQGGDLVALDVVDSNETLTSGTSLEELKTRLTSLEERNRALEGQLEEMTRERDHLADEITTTSSREEALGEKYQEEMSQASLSMCQLEEEKKTMSERLDRLQSETNDLIASLQQRADTAEAAREVVEKELEQLKQQKSTDESDATSSLEKRAAAVEQQLKEAMEQLEKATAELEQGRKAEDELTAARDQLQRDEAELRTEMSELRSSLEAAESARSELETLVGKHKEELVIVRGQRELLEKEFETKKEDVQQLTESNEQKDLDQQALTEKLSVVLREKEEAVGKLSSLQQRLDETETRLQQLQDQLDQEQTIKDTAAKDVQSQSQQMEELAASLLKETARVAELDQQYKEQLRQSDEKLAAAKEEADKAKEELQQVNGRVEKLRREQENVISELRAQVDSARSVANAEKQQLETKLNELQVQLNSALTEVTSTSEFLEEQKAALASTENKLKTFEQTAAVEKAESEKIREQYSSALEKLKQDLAEAVDSGKSASSLEATNHQLTDQLEQLKKEHEESLNKLKQSSEEALREAQSRAEKSVAKAKQTADQEITSAKAELMLQIDQLRSTLSERECKLDDVVLEKARLEQQLISSDDLKKELEQRKEKEKQLSSKLSELERRLIALEADNRILAERKTELEKLKEQSGSQLGEKTQLIEQLEAKVKTLEESNEESFRKAAAKQDQDSKKVVRELQREVKQLYVELNEKTEALDTLRAKTAETQNGGVEPKMNNVQMTSLNAAPPKDYMYEEELESMRRKLNECHREIDNLRDVNGMLERNLENSKKVQTKSPAVIPVNGGSNGHDHYDDRTGFADPAQAEYLRNVLYRYMAERESLGKESMTLARVIGTVANFNQTQLDAVIAKEETRLAGWVGGTMSQVMSGTRH